MQLQENTSKHFESLANVNTVIYLLAWWPYFRRKDILKVSRPYVCLSGCLISLPSPLPIDGFLWNQ